MPSKRNPSPLPKGQYVVKEGVVATATVAILPLHSNSLASA